MKTKNDTLNAIQTMVDNAVSNAGFNSTRNAIILARNANNTYKIKMDGVEYDNVICYGCGIFQTNEVAKVIIPNGQPSQMFLLAINPHPIGTIYQTSNVNFDPNVEWGGVWVKIEGKVLVGLDANDTDFDTVGETGGEKTHTLAVNEMPSHSHTPTTSGYKFLSSNANIAVNGTGRNFPSSGGSNHFVYTAASSGEIGESDTTSAVGRGEAYNNMPPYEVVIIWKRTA